MEIFVFSFWFLDLQCTIPYLNGIPLLVWLFRLGCNPYAASTLVHNWLRIFYSIILLSLIVYFRYCNTHLSFSLSSLVILVNLVHSNDIYGSMLGLPLFANHSSFATIECRMSASFFYSIVKLSSMFYKPLFDSEYIVALKSSPNKSIDYLM